MDPPDSDHEAEKLGREVGAARQRARL